MFQTILSRVSSLRSTESATATTKTTEAAQQRGNQSQACFDAKLKEFHSDMGEYALVSNDMMNEWHSSVAFLQSESLNSQ
ncbi:hypothetical protein WI96_20700 [Burkholderia vietnamiensis]|nr:hypothetical protein WI96_20700 [Burkholderia vietnamiensis]